MLHFHFRHALAALASALCFSASARPTSEWSYLSAFDQGFSSETGFDQQFQTPKAFQRNFDDATWSTGGAAASGFSLSAQTAKVAAAANPDTQSVYAGIDGTKSRALAEKSGGAVAFGLGSSLDLTLWNFIANIRAQQNGSHFELLQTSAASIDYTLNNSVSAVPLPASTWLFVMGLLGLCGYRLGVGAKATREQRSSVLPAVA